MTALPPDDPSCLDTLLRWRRDVRHFRPDPLPPETLDALLASACLAPSVGLSEPWRFCQVTSAARRRAIRDEFERCNAIATAGRGVDRNDYARLKLAGLDQAPHHVAVFSERDPAQGRGLGRMTMPETTVWSTMMAIHTFWLAATARGVGVGWVSILDPARVAACLDAPLAWEFVAYLCVGRPLERADTPELERRGWERRRPETARWHVI
ncbi:nitroreductase [Ameyamaea chiangmaiensis NBRC 103196]|uniref:5,6-dimethylbenzimidazole synthase n=1 Tax=Ameyamaea chiangmaiensis TaxID=442969 RepID=A0A850PGA3_9PROT|nr:5,6-dimethylbenzimidazole synthase [Ameyamaea chiangmaiensis]MBS4076265.1 5,6-dimethylbenzimidazole synthase [Ameyamaea chiangmaiensis]NVN41460.1 5,6-dimethylbenzimidazole synthase [Ameyamaea chiangmaiensis]GBQ64757.1 nitroreductase [Ameyamaea chiangmaiensis NBRC 103196]